MNPVIQTRNLSKQFNDFTAVKDVTFSVEKGEVLGYLGPNGSGKTTTIRMLMGLLLPSGGDAKVLGCDTVTDSEAIRKQTGYMSQKFSLYHDLTVEENLVFYAGIYGVSSRKRVDEVLEMVNLESHQRTLVSQLSTGWRQRLALAAAIIHQPKLLFLDEPTSGVDPTTRRSFWDLIYNLVDQGVTVFVTTHYMDEAEYCRRVGIMRGGELLALDTPAALKTETLQGIVWDIHAEPLLGTLSFLQQLPQVQKIRLSGDHISAITDHDVNADFLKKKIKKQGGRGVKISPMEPTLEDVFLSLAVQK